MDYSERMLRREIEKLPDGTYEAEGHLDGFVDHPDPRYQNLTIKVALTVDGSEMTVDLTGTDAAGRPADQHAARRHRRHRDLGDAALDPARRGDARSRCRRTRASSVRSGSSRPRAASRTRPSRRRRSRASAAATSSPTPSCAPSRPVLPEGVSAGVGNLKVVAYSGFRGGQHWVYMDIQEGSLRRPLRQGRPRRRRHALREHAQQPDRGHRVALPAARHAVRAARGPRRCRQVARRARQRARDRVPRRRRLLARGRRLRVGAAGTVRRQGRHAGSRAARTAGPSAELELPSKFPYRKAAAGDRLCLISPCGGGYGDPLERDRDARSSGHRRRIREPRVGSRPLRRQGDAHEKAGRSSLAAARGAGGDRRCGRRRRRAPTARRPTSTSTGRCRSSWRPGPRSTRRRRRAARRSS